jgi:hypothetical protein
MTNSNQSIYSQVLSVNINLHEEFLLLHVFVCSLEVYWIIFIIESIQNSQETIQMKIWSARFFRHVAETSHVMFSFIYWWSIAFTCDCSLFFSLGPTVISHLLIHTFLGQFRDKYSTTIKSCWTYQHEISRSIVLP